MKPKTNIAVLLLIGQTPTDSSVQLTAMRHLEQINEYIRGSSRPIVVTVDMGLYRPMKQLHMILSETGWILLPGDLHIIMAMLRCIGDYIDMTDLPEVWTDSGLFSESIVKQLLQGKPLRRSFRAHLATFQALNVLRLDEFYMSH